MKRLKKCMETQKTTISDHSQFYEIVQWVSRIWTQAQGVMVQCSTINTVETTIAKDD